MLEEIKLYIGFLEKQLKAVSGRAVHMSELEISGECH